VLRAFRSLTVRGASARHLDPGSFAVVMATGIVSQAMRMDGASLLSAALLAVAAAAYLVLAAATVWRLAAWRAEFRADVADPARAFSFFTVAAASGVLAAGLAADGGVRVAVVLLAVGGAAWLLLSATVPVLAARWRGEPPALARANGTWFLWAVGAQSAAVAAAALRPAGAAVTGAIAVGCWAAGVALYLLVAAVVVTSLLRYPPRPAEVTAPYWIFMGASAISVLAGTLILRLPAGPSAAAARAVVPGVTVALWAFGTALIPLLAATGVWRHLLHRVPLRYEIALWSIVFPLGMHAVATGHLGGTLRQPWMTAWGRVEGWIALAVWLAVASAAAAATVRPARRSRVAAGQPRTGRYAKKKRARLTPSPAAPDPARAGRPKAHRRRPRTRATP
jgi:tellurite resistance protein TehA-like permease